MRFIMMVIFVSIFYGCQEKTELTLYSDKSINESKLVYKVGRIFREKNKIKVFMSFYKNGPDDVMDTDKRLTVYLSGEKYDQTDRRIDHLQYASFIYVQTRSLYGHLSIDKIEIKKYNDKKSILSCLLSRDKIINSRTKVDSIKLNIEHINLQEVGSLEELLIDEIAFDREIRQENASEWHW